MGSLNPTRRFLLWLSQTFLREDFKKKILSSNLLTRKPPLVIGTLASAGWSGQYPIKSLRGRAGTRVSSLKNSA